MMLLHPVRRPSLSTLCGALSLLLSIGAQAAEPLVIATFDDAAGDATGPGGYTLPVGPGFTDGDFDLRRFSVSLDGDEVVFTVTLGANFRQPDVTQRENSSELQLWNGIYLQNIDIYIDSDRTEGAGFTACIPGRRVAFEAGRSWETAVVLTPQPGPARAITEEALGRQAAAHVIFVQGLHTSGRTVTARVPVIALGGVPRRDWAYSVHVSGASWERSFGVSDRFRGARAPNAFTMPVLPVPDLWAFGGAPPEGNAHPLVLDVLLPAWADQRAVLGSYDAASGALARVPFYDLDGFARPAGGAAAPASKLSLTLAARDALAAQPKAGVELRVAFIAGDMISLNGTTTGLKTLQFGRVLGPDGATVARVVLTQLVEGGAVANAVDNRDKVLPGAKVRFDAQ